MTFPCGDAMKRGQCNADCCGPIPMSGSEIDSLRDKFQQKPIEMKAFMSKFFIITEDGMCIFLTKDKRCAIYDDRPQICRDYGIVPQLPCPFIKPNGRPRSPAMVRRTQRLINKDCDRTMNKYNVDLNKIKPSIDRQGILKEREARK